ncbi:hypothetical protein BC834DRAFT_842651 [Gloeopeniophorella convolvens]|nr:hypothetical protein BC834DRAFT_842651 [Gloeopeniophorella convolvens]
MPGTNFGKIWPTIATGNSTERLGLDALVRVDGLTYSFLGDVGGINVTVNLTNTLVTPTQTVVTAVAGPLQVNLTFLNPIEPGDFVKQSIPFSYMSLTAKSLDGNAHSVQVYSDVSGEWNSGDRSHEIVWSQPADPDVIIHTVNLQQQVTFAEIQQQAEWGTLYYAMKAGNAATWKIDGATTSRNAFVANGSLDNQGDTNFRAISTNFPVFAISQDLGNIQSTQVPVVWTVGYTTDPAINYTDTPDSTQQRPLFYKSKYDGDDKSLTLDSKIQRDATSISPQYWDLVSIASAQVYGSTQLTVGTDPNSKSKYNTSDVMMFMKNVGGTNSNRVNAVETLYAAFPMFMYIDPSLGAPLLEPLLRWQAGPAYTPTFAAKDLGSTYPNVAGGNADHTEGIEQSGNMLIMVMEASSADMSSSDGLTVANQTNLAIKGIIALEAMSKMSAIVKESGDASKYSTTAANFYNEWKGLALDTDQHLLAVYGNASSWTLGYNLFADVWLGTNLVDSSVLDGHASFIDNLASTSSFASFGLPVDSLNSDTMTTISSWNLFAAAITPNTDLRDSLISRVHSHASSNTSAGAFPLNYDSTHGSTLGGVASPAQGAMYAPLALMVLARPIAGTGNGAAWGSSPKKTSHGGAIAGGIIAGLAALLIVIGIVVFVQRRRKNRAMDPISSTFSKDLMESGPPTRVTPFDPTPIAAPSEAQTRPEFSGSTTQLTEVPGLRVAEATGSGSSPSTSSRPLPALPPAPAPDPVGLSSKELARLRTENLRQQQQQQHSTPLDAPIISMSPPPEATAEPGGASLSGARQLPSEVESILRDFLQLHAERSEGPPSYYSEQGTQ